MAEQSKASLISQLEQARNGVAHSLGGLAHRLDVQARLGESVSKHKTLWFSGAAVAGFLLTRLPLRRKKVKVIGEKKMAKNSGFDWHSLLLLPLLEVGVAVLKPTIKAFVAKKIADLTTDGLFSKSSRDNWHD